MSGILAGKRILLTGVLTDKSLAFGIAQTAQAEGATIVLTGFGRTLNLTKRIARKLEGEVPVVELDVQSEADLAALPERVREHVDALDGLVHAIGFAPASTLGNGVLAGQSWEDVGTALHISTWSYPALAHAALPLLSPGSSYVGLDFDARQAWPMYDWMGVAKAGLESANRYLARDLGPHGVRANLVAAGPLRTMAAKSIPGFAQFEDTWAERAPLGWDCTDTVPVARTVAMALSDWMPATTGQILYVDGGFSAVGA